MIQVISHQHAKMNALQDKNNVQEIHYNNAKTVTQIHAQNGVMYRTVMIVIQHNALVQITAIKIIIVIHKQHLAIINMKTRPKSNPILASEVITELHLQSSL